MNKILLLVILFLSPSLAHADFINGGFETGNFTGWSTAGDALVIDASLGIPPPAGNFQALITNAPALFIPGGHSESYSGVSSIAAYSGGPSITSPLEAFLGLPLVDDEPCSGVGGEAGGVRPAGVHGAPQQHRNGKEARLRALPEHVHAEDEDQREREPAHDGEDGPEGDRRADQPRDQPAAR